MKSRQKKNSGITLIVLVVTLIILLFLVGITISGLTGSGLFENTKLAEQKSKEAQEKEDTTLVDYENRIGEYIDSSRADTQTSNIKMCSPKLLCNISLPWESRNAGTYIASSTSYTKNNSEGDFSNFLSFKENTGWKVLKNGWYNFNFVFVDAYQSGNDWIQGLLYINGIALSVHYTYVNKADQYDVQGKNYATTLYLKKDDIVDYKHKIFPTSLSHSFVNIQIFAMSE